VEGVEGAVGAVWGRVGSITVGWDRGRLASEDCGLNTGCRSSIDKMGKIEAKREREIGKRCQILHERCHEKKQYSQLREKKLRRKEKRKT